MLFLCRNLIFLVLALSTGGFALSGIHVDKAAVGDRVLVLTFDDSIKSPDLSKLQVEGYSIENVVFVEEATADSTRFSPDYIDLTLPGNGKVIGYSQDNEGLQGAGTRQGSSAMEGLDDGPDIGVMLVDFPPNLTPRVGHILADTAFGGLFRRVISIEGQPILGMLGYRWVLHTVEADLPEAILDCDLTFKTRLDLNQSLADISQESEAFGELEDGTSTHGIIGYTLQNAQVLFQPTVTGRLRIKDGKVDRLHFWVEGHCDVMANIKGSISGLGHFEMDEELMGKRPTLVSLGSGLFLRIQNRTQLRMEARAKTETYSAQSTFRIQNALKAEIGLKEGQWRPMAENKMTLVEKTLPEFSGEGVLKISLKPRIEMLLDGVHGPAFTFENFARYSSTPHPSQAEAGNRQMSLGTTLLMDMRTNFTRPKSLRTFLLFNREQMVYSPPREGVLALKEADSNCIAFSAQTFPKADYYIVQHRMGMGAWESSMDIGLLPKIRIKDLKPNSQYRFRVIGVNAMGPSSAFPTDGIAFTTPALNTPPMMPVANFPDSGSILGDTAINLVWQGHDPDPGTKLSYTLILDPRFPPQAVRATGIKDTVLRLSGLELGKTYFWKVIASDGIEKSESKVNTFSLLSRAQMAKGDSLRNGGGEQQSEVKHPTAILVPTGTFRREDGKSIKVGPFYMDKHEVTQTEFQRVVGENPSYRFGDSLPVERVTWDEAVAYCREKGGRLPTEAEWEYAARGGSADPFYWGNGNPADFAWFRENSNNHSQKVGLKKPNQWGLHDMAGNVFEWVEDWHGEYSPDAVDHPQGPKSGLAKVIRGASWYSESGNLNLSARYSNRPGFRNFKVGFRCAKDVDDTAMKSHSPTLLGILR